MMAIEVHIPDDLSKTLDTVTDDVETFIVMAIRNELARTEVAADEVIEVAAAIDQPDDFLTSQELQYYLNLPNHVQTR